METSEVLHFDIHKFLYDVLNEDIVYDEDLRLKKIIEEMERVREIYLKFINYHPESDIKLVEYAGS